MKKISFVLSITALLGSAAAVADDMPEADVQGAVDNPILSRYAGSMIVYSFKRGFEETDLVAGKYKHSDSDANLVPTHFENTVHLEGTVTRTAYVFPADRSGLEVMRNYGDALRKANMSIVYSCDKSACGVDGPSVGNPSAFTISFAIAKMTEMGLAFNVAESNDESGESRYVLAKSAGADGAITYAAIFVVPPEQYHHLGAILVETVQPAAMQTGKVSVDLSADDMAKSIVADGRVALYGLQFDTDKAELRTDSKPSLMQIAKLLSQNPKLNVFVVGHSDNQGTYAHNVELSQKRSDAIVLALTSEFKVAPGRLLAKGIASVSPIASNDSETGRAKNRRVELVKE
jgi:outer membrane protein OmpA-like peptidoglycan-associated protein